VIGQQARQGPRSRRAIVLILNTVGILLGIGLGMWPPFVGFTIYLGGFAGGLGALVLGAVLTQRVLKTDLPEDTMMLVVFLGILHLFVLTGILTTFLPPFYAAWGLADVPVPIELATLDRAALALPAYVRIEGVPQPRLSIQDVYQTPRSKHQAARTITVDWVPLVPGDWRSPDPVRVLAERGALEDGARDRATTVTGMLYPFSPRWGERFMPHDSALYSSFEGIGLRANWLQEKAEFSFRADDLYLLSAGSPTQLRQPLIILAILLLGYLGVLVRLSLHPPK